MSNIKKIMVPFDFSESAIHALDYALNYVGINNPIQIIAVNVRVSPVGESETKELNESFTKILENLSCKAKMNPVFIPVTGDLIKTLLHLQAAQEINLIVMGTMGDASAFEAVTNTSKLVLEANCPVISVPFGCEIKIPEDIALVLGKEEIEDAKVLQVLLDIARNSNARVHALTIYSDSIYDEKKVSEKTENTLEYYLEHFYAEHVFNKNEDIEQGILDYVSEKDIDVLAILPRNHVEKDKPSEGRLTKLLTLHSNIPVLTLD